MLNKVYIVNEVCDDEYGSTEVVAVFATRKAAEAYMAENQYTWEPWWCKEERNALTVTEWEVQ